MKHTNGVTLPASFVVTVSHAGTEILPTVQAENDILTLAEGGRTAQVQEVFDLQPDAESRSGAIRQPRPASTDGSALQEVEHSRLARIARDSWCLGSHLHPLTKDHPILSPFPVLAQVKFIHSQGSDGKVLHVTLWLPEVKRLNR